jgi:hypothetical protein
MPLITPSPTSIWQKERVVTRLKPKPAKGSPFITEYNKREDRASDFHAEYPSATFMRNSYAKRQAFNCDKTFYVLQSSDGFWHLYSASTLLYIRRLQGPAGDNAEVQWDKKAPHVLYYGEINGGTHIYRLDVTTNTHTVQYDFTADVHALFPAAVHDWSGAEGSPSLDGRLWGFKCETDPQFQTIGFIVLDIFAKQIVWHMTNPSGDPDFVTISPSGRYFITSDFDGTFAYPLDGSPRKIIHHTVEHADTFTLPNGHDGWVTIDYQSDNGDLFWVDIDDPSLTKHVFDHAYHNVFYGTSYAFHFSGRATRKPGFVVVSNLGMPPCNMYILNTATGKIYPFGTNYAIRSQYFDEPHACPSDDLSRVIFNDNYGVTGNIDAYIVSCPPIT